MPRNFLIPSRYPNYDILNKKNNIDLMRKNHFANVVKDLINFNDKIYKKCEKTKSKLTLMLREDWKCYIQDRERFLPDFETLEKRSVGVIRKI